MTAPAVLCINCRHYNQAAFDCFNPANVEASLVDGKPKPIYAPAYLRGTFNKCGRDGQWFAPKLEVA